jgi:hypothetical protein
MSITIVDHASQEDFWTDCVCCGRPLKVAIGLDGAAITPGWYGRKCAAVLFGRSTNKASLDTLEIEAMQAQGAREAARVSPLVGAKPRVWGERAGWHDRAFALTTLAPQSVAGRAFSAAL